MVFSPCFQASIYSDKDSFADVSGGDIQIKRLGLVDMPLSFPRSPDAPMLVNPMGFFIVPSRLGRQIRSRKRSDRPPFLLHKIFGINRINARRRSGNQGGRSGRCHGE